MLQNPVIMLCTLCCSLFVPIMLLKSAITLVFNPSKSPLDTHRLLTFQYVSFSPNETTNRAIPAHNPDSPSSHFFASGNCACAVMHYAFYIGLLCWHVARCCYRSQNYAGIKFAPLALITLVEKIMGGHFRDVPANHENNPLYGISLLWWPSTLLCAYMQSPHAM